MTGPAHGSGLPLERLRQPGLDAFLLRTRVRQIRRLEQLGYRIVVAPLGDGQFYWHVWRAAERVNGGLSETRAEARLSAEFAASRDDCSAPFPGDCRSNLARSG